MISSTHPPSCRGLPIRRFARFRLLLLLACAGVAAPAQQPFSQLSPADLTHAYVEHANSYIQHVSSTPDRAQLYTYLILHRDQNFFRGKVTLDQTYLSELIFIGGLPYIHRLEHNGKPLQGEELDRENEVYAKTIQERTGLTDEVRRKLLRVKAHSVLPYPLDQLESQFHPEITAHPVFDGHPSILLELTPLHPDAPPALQRHIVLTLDADNLNVLQSHVELLAPDKGFSQNTLFVDRNTYFEGTLLPAANSIDTIVQIKHLLHHEDLHLIGTEAMTNYRRFTTTVTLKSTPNADAPTPPN